VSHDLVTAPTARSWRDIPQPVKPRAMSRGGQRRLIAAALRGAGVIALVGAVLGGGWEIAAALRESPSAAKLAGGGPLAPPVLRTTRDGVLDAAWLARTLALPAKISLTELDLARVRQQVLADGQVLSAVATKQYPNRLVVQVTERQPVARIMADAGGERKTLLVARDGVVYSGTNYAAATLDSLPWLDGIALTRKGGALQPIAGMDTLSEFLAKAQLEAERLYRTWDVVSLARLESDHEIEVRTREPHACTIIFGASGDYFRQLAKLDYLWDHLASHPAGQVRIDLSLGAQVPVYVTDARPDDGGVRLTTTPNKRER